MTPCVLLCLLALGCAVESSRVKRIIGGEPAEEPPFFNITASKTSTTTQQPVTDEYVFVRKDKRSAVVNGVQNDDGTSSFLGIRYAEAPVKRFRFQRPKRLKLKGQIDATKFGNPCPQPNPFKKGSVIGKEDCLYLNVFTPEAPGPGDSKSKKYPVIVWIHGGNYKGGSAAQYVPTDLVKKGVVVVTINYRLGSLGFLSLGRKELPGNVGLFDISMAMRWVRDYIKFFGGNPKKIIPAGQGSGASCATMLALNKFTKSSLSGILAMSGSPVSPFALDENENATSQEISTEDGCKVEEGVEFVRCMQDLPLDEVLRGDFNAAEKMKKKNEFPKGLANLNTPGPNEEGSEDDRFLPHFVVESPLQAIKKGIFPKIPLMTGVTKDETGGGVKGNFLEDIQKKLLSPDFLQKGIFNSALNANTGLFVNKTVNPQLSSLFLNGDYLKFFTTLISSALSDIEKVVKHTTDAFFNLPAFLTSHLWSQKTDVFLYSFEHIPEHSLTNKNLYGVPMVSLNPSKEKKTGAEHGDDLHYLFDIRGLNGEVQEENKLSEADLKVRDQFTTMVAEFARTGVPSANWAPFNAKDGSYMIITENPKLAKNFHKCEMGLWSGDESLLKSPECSVIGPAADLAKSAGSTLLSTVNGASSRLGLDQLTNSLSSNIPTDNPLDKVGNPLDQVKNPLQGFGLGGGTNNQNKNNPTTQKPSLVSTTKKKGLLGGAFGGGGGGGGGLLG